MSNGERFGKVHVHLKAVRMISQGEGPVHPPADALDEREAEASTGRGMQFFQGLFLLSWFARDYGRHNVKERDGAREVSVKSCSIRRALSNHEEARYTAFPPKER